MEPNKNPRVTRSLRQTFYNFSRRYGEKIVLNKVDTSDTDYASGGQTRTYTTLTIRNAVQVPSIAQREVTYTAAMMQAMRQFAWQGGAGQDIEETGFLVSDRDIRGWGDVDPTQYIEWRGDSYEVTRSNTYDGGVIIWVKAAKGSRA